MKTTPLPAVLVAALVTTVASAGSRTMALRSGGSVRLPENPAGFTPTVSVDGSLNFLGFVAVGEEPATPEGVSFQFIRQGRKPPVSGRATLVANADGTLTARWTFTMNEDASKVDCCVSLRLPRADFPRDSFTTGERSVRVDGIEARFPAGAKLSASDGFSWWPYAPYWFLNFATTSATDPKKGDTFEIECVFASEDGSPLTPAYVGPVVVSDEPGGGWVRMDYRKTVLPGSALDLSGLLDAPAGKHGWLRNAGGRFEFEGRPGKEVRFCGVNFCDDLCYPDTPEQAVLLADRIQRHGYNSMRIHHYDKYYARYEDGRLVPIPENVERLDRVVAECIRRGIYLTTDLFVSRPVKWREMGIDRDGEIPMGVFKAFQETTERGFQDWCDFSRLFLSHVNPYTGRSYAAEPAMPLICLQNETAFGSCWAEVMTDPALEGDKLWREFLLDARAKNANAFPGFDPDAPPGGGHWWDATAETAVKSAFWAYVESRFCERAERFLREELGVKAILTGDNYGPTPAFIQEMRQKNYGYCDAHLYAGGWWKWLGGSGGYTSPGLVKAHNLLATFRTDTEGYAYSRLWGSPFVITEWDFVGPTADRSMGGLLFGAVAGIQGWSGAWRFSYGCNINNLGDNRGIPSLYQFLRDPLAVAADRATVLLYLRGDIPEAQDALALDFGDAELDPTLGHTYVSGPHWANWRYSDIVFSRRVGVSVRGKDIPENAAVMPQSAMDGQSRPPFDVATPRFTRIDREKGVFTVDTPRTCGVFAGSGEFTAGGLRVRIDGKGAQNRATVFASSLDGAPLAESRRILVSHLTDAKSRGATFMDDSRLVLLNWSEAKREPDGTRPPLLREGTAEISLSLSGSPRGIAVYALGSDGRREGRVPATLAPDGTLTFTASVRQPFGACMLYEILTH